MYTCVLRDGTVELHIRSHIIYVINSSINVLHILPGWRHGRYDPGAAGENRIGADPSFFHPVGGQFEGNDFAMGIELVTHVPVERRHTAAEGQADGGFLSRPVGFEDACDLAPP
jgi:hypothetical protein